MSDLLRSALLSLPGGRLHASDAAWAAGGPFPQGLTSRIEQEYRYDLETLGWDTDLLVRASDATAHAVLVDLADGRVIIKVHPNDDVVLTRLRAIPGIAWSGTHSHFYGHVNPRTARCLRVALTGRATTLSADAGPALAAAANAPIPTEMSVDGEHIVVTTPNWPALRDDLQRTPGVRWDGTRWIVDATPANAKAFLAVARTHDLVVDESLDALAAEAGRPFDYDLTIQGLVGVPTSDVHAVAAQPARGKTASLEDRLAKMDLRSVWDLLMHIPLRYIDRNNKISLSALAAHVGEEISLIARVIEVGAYNQGNKMTRVKIGDGTGFLDVTFFRSPWIGKRFKRGDEVLVHGKVSIYQPKSGSAKFQMTNPMMDPLGEDTANMVPVYPQSATTAKVTTWEVHRAVMESVGRLGDLTDPIPEHIIGEHNLIGRKAAFVRIHRPDTMSDVAAARHRLAFDELLRMQLVLGIQRNRRASEIGVVHAPTGELSNQLIAALPYNLTGAQQRAIKEITDDLCSPHPMHRMLQGDVGVGKTTVASLSILAAVEGGFQAALMAPTEILATQLHAELAETFARLNHPETGTPLVVEFLGGKTTAKNKRRVHAGLADGTVHVVVGTHALLVDDVTFNNLGFVVIDEQHRFGVEQRAALRAKGVGGSPDVLAMTATPIPRTASLTVFGDLEQSILDEMPPGRTPIRTSWIPSEAPIHDPTAAVWEKIKSQVSQGRQAYVVASLVEDNEKIAAASAEETFEALQHGPLASLRLGLVHGQMARDEREATMAAFKDGDIDVLVSTTVIEVGVNVPNATVMVVLDAPRFGIAQLHQIRGRVGRGRFASECVLIGEAKSDDGRERMEALVESTDGFYLSDVDLRLRGGGALFGTRQSGQSDLRVAKLPDDIEMVYHCRRYATDLLKSDPDLRRRPGLRHEVFAALGEDAGDALTRI